MDKDHGLHLPKKGDVFHCHKCTMELQITSDCKCSAAEHVHFHCCNEEMHKKGPGQK